MKKLIYYTGLIVGLFSIVCSVTSCNDDDDDVKNTWKEYEKWRDLNTEFFDEQKYSVDDNGHPYYSTVIAQWNPGAEILIHYFNDRSLTVGNLKPLLTSTVDVKYRGMLCTGVAFDSSYLRTDSIFRTRLSNTIEGWWIALCNMNVGDSARVIIPYGVAYKGTGQGSIPPYSTLVFDVKLVDIPYYEVER